MPKTNDISRWDSREGLTRVERFFRAVEEGREIHPGGDLDGNPVDLRGIQFPDVQLCKEFDLPSFVVQHVSGNRTISGAVLRTVDLSQGRLSFSVWEKCLFENVVFNKTQLASARFFGCKIKRSQFCGVEFKDASISLATDGTETEITDTTFERVDFRGAACHNPNFTDVYFKNCKLKGFVFDGARLDRATFVGKYHELRFRGTAGEVERNRVSLDLSQADVVWLSANHGIDMSRVILPADGSALILGSRTQAIEEIARAVGERLPFSRPTVSFLRTLFSDRSPSPLSDEQRHFYVSRSMIAECSDDLSPQQVDAVYEAIRTVAMEKRYLVVRQG